MNKLSQEQRARVVAALVEGNSIRATVRMTGVAKNTVVKLLVDLGRACDEYQRRTLVNLGSKRIQCDEIWSFVGSKNKNVPPSRVGEWGDVWTWTAIDADSKLMVSWLVGSHDAGCAHEFMQEVAARLANRVQLTSDGQKLYVAAVDAAFGTAVDYAQLVKLYGEQPENRQTRKRYSPATLTGTRNEWVCGMPDADHISTSFVERANLTMRMSMRRFTRLTNAFSRKIENHTAAVALHFMYYNFARVHQTLRVTPAMEASVSDHVWSLAEIVALLD